jgi:hypothetical protein
MYTISANADGMMSCPSIIIDATQLPFGAFPQKHRLHEHHREEIINASVVLYQNEISFHNLDRSYGT